MTTFTSHAGFVFSAPSGSSTATFVSSVRLKVIAEAASDPVQMYAGSSSSLTSLMRVGLGPSFSDPTPHRAVIEIEGGGVAAGASWSFRFARVSWSGQDTFVLIGENSATGHELFIPVMEDTTLFPTVTTTSQARAFLSAVTGVVVMSLGTTLANFSGSWTEHDALTGTESYNAFSLGLGQDTVRGLGGGDDVYGGDGNDVLYGGLGDDQLRGDAGVDRIYGEDDDDNLWGGAGADQISGGNHADWLVGDADHDTLNGDAGNDLLEGGTGNDKVYGGSDRDSLQGQEGNDGLFGGAGNDQLIADWGRDTLNGGDGNDSLVADGYVFDGINRGADGLDLIYGGKGNDNISEGSGIEGGSNHLYGDAGNDTISGSGNDTVYGGSGNDQITRVKGNSVLTGGAGKDTIDGGLGRDKINGGDGADTLFVSQGNGSVVKGEAGADKIDGRSSARFELYGGSGADTFILSLTATSEQRSAVYGGSESDLVALSTYDSVSAISRSGDQLTLTGTNGAKMAFYGIEKYYMSGYGTMSAATFYDFWNDLLN